MLIDKPDAVFIQPLFGRSVAQIDDISLMLADINLILAKYKLTDDILDEKKGKLKQSLFNKGYKRAVKRNKKVDEIVKNQYLKFSQF